MTRPSISAAASALARLSRLNPTDAQREASRRNGAKGGRPRKGETKGGKGAGK